MHESNRVSRSEGNGSEQVEPKPKPGAKAELPSGHFFSKSLSAVHR